MKQPAFGSWPIYRGRHALITDVCGAWHEEKDRDSTAKKHSMRAGCQSRFPDGLLWAHFGKTP